MILEPIPLRFLADAVEKVDAADADMTTVAAVADELEAVGFVQSDSAGLNPERYESDPDLYARWLLGQLINLARENGQGVMNSWINLAREHVAEHGGGAAPATGLTVMPEAEGGTITIAQPLPPVLTFRLRADGKVDAEYDPANLTEAARALIAEVKRLQGPRTCAEVHPGQAVYHRDGH